MMPLAMFDRDQLSMTFQEGDFFEEIYQLKKEVALCTQPDRVRWYAEEYSGGDKKQVLIDFFAYEYDSHLHWETDIQNILKIGQSASKQVRYFVWETDKARTLMPLAISEVSVDEKRKFLKIMEELSLSANEMLFSSDIPDYWRTDQQEVLFFYRKQVSLFANQKQNAEILHFWTKILAPQELPAQPVQVQLPPVPTKPVVTVESSRVRAAPEAWRLFLIAIGILLSISVYFLKTAYPSGSSSESGATPAVFNKTLEAGIFQEKRGNYELAVQLFEKAANLPLSDQTQTRLDSLGEAYRRRASRECAKFKSLGSSNLFFIADQYFHYASILTGKTPAQKCE